MTDVWSLAVRMSLGVWETLAGCDCTTAGTTTKTVPNLT